MSGAIVAGAIMAATATATSLYTSHQQSKAQKEAAKTQAAAQQRANQLQEQANSTAEQENNRASKMTARNYEAADTGNNTGVYNSNGALGFGTGDYNLGSNNALGSSVSDEDVLY